MNRRTAVRTLMAAGAGSFVSRLAAGPQDDPDNYVIHSDVRLVVLQVSVSGRKGGFVSGLPQESFRVFEDDRPQPITVFERRDIPVTVGILVDESRSMGPKRSDVLTAALSFLAESNPDDEVFVLNFNDTVEPGLPGPALFSDNREQLREALFRGVSEGRTALYDAVVAGLKQLEAGKNDRKALVLISDGGDNNSHATRRETMERIVASTATVYTVGLFDTDDPDRDPGILQQLAKISGGEVYFPDKPAEMVPVCRRIARDIRNRYTLGFVPMAGKETRGVRRIRVEVSSPGYSGLTAHTRTSYRFEEADQRK